MVFEWVLAKWVDVNLLTGLRPMKYLTRYNGKITEALYNEGGGEIWFTVNGREIRVSEVYTAAKQPPRYYDVLANNVGGNGR